MPSRLRHPSYPPPCRALRLHVPRTEAGIHVQAPPRTHREHGAAYPELDAQKELIAKVIKEEEDSFLRTLETGIRLLEKTMADAKAAGKNEISGKDAFTLYDTFGSRST